MCFTVVQMVNHWHLTVEASVHSQAILCAICCG